MILINFKIYKETWGEGAVNLAKICKLVMDKTGVKIIPVVSALDVYRVSREVDIKVIVQHTDGMIDGPKTGYIALEQAKQSGAIGSVINHSEHVLKPGTIKKMLAANPKDFLSVVCLQTWGQVEGWAKNIKPSMIAYEPKELIGNKEKSVASEKPEMIKKFVEFYKDIPILVGAGIHSKEDIKIGLELGAKGFILATDVVKAANPEKELFELARAFKAYT